MTAWTASYRTVSHHLVRNGGLNDSVQVVSLPRRPTKGATAATQSGNAAPPPSDRGERDASALVAPGLSAGRREARASDLLLRAVPRLSAAFLRSGMRVRLGVPWSCP